MTRPIRNTGPCFPSGLPRQRDVLSHTEFYTPIFCMLSVFQAIPFELQRKPPTVNKWDYSWHSRTGTSITINIVPKCEVCPRDHGKVVESLRGLYHFAPWQNMKGNKCDSEHSENCSVFNHIYFHCDSIINVLIVLIVISVLRLEYINLR